MQPLEIEGSIKEIVVFLGGTKTDVHAVGECCIRFHRGAVCAEP